MSFVSNPTVSRTITSFSRSTETNDQGSDIAAKLRAGKNSVVKEELKPADNLATLKPATVTKRVVPDWVSRLNSETKYVPQRERIAKAKS